jgi:hypothetical protein
MESGEANTNTTKPSVKQDKNLTKESDVVSEHQAEHIESLRATRALLMENYQRTKDDILDQINQIDKQLAKDRVSLQNIISNHPVFEVTYQI